MTCMDQSVFLISNDLTKIVICNHQLKCPTLDYETSVVLFLVVAVDPERRGLMKFITIKGSLSSLYILFVFLSLVLVYQVFIDFS